jgi:meso-butanediol dehydrogenase / (S,S)-butanediol dehydrogenase / diacetyl reductase
MAGFYPIARELSFAVQLLKTKGFTMRLKNKAALITGGSRGIGFAVAERFAEEGAQVVIFARNVERGEKAAASVGAFFVAGDVASGFDCQSAVDETLAKFGRLDVLVNSAGIIYRNRTVEETSEVEWDATFDVNVKGTFLMSKAALPALRKTQGAIVNLSSYVGMVGFAGASAYAASKAAIINLTRTMALDHAKEQIRVNAVCPGSVETDMIRNAWKQFDDEAAARRLWESKHPLGRIATPREVANAVLFLASEEASFITGVALPVDGGITAG